MKKLADPQQVILDYMISFTEEHAYPPSVREICAAGRLAVLGGLRLSAGGMQHSQAAQRRQQRRPAESAERQGIVSH